MYADIEHLVHKVHLGRDGLGGAQRCVLRDRQMDRQREETTGDTSAGPHLCFPVIIFQTTKKL